MIQAWAAQVMGDYFRAAGISIVRGRDFTSADRAGAPLVAIVNRTLAGHYWPGQDPIGKRLHMGLVVTDLPWMTVAGEIGDVKQIAADANTESQIYTPIAQYTASISRFATPDTIAGNFGSIVVRSEQPPEQMIYSLRAIVRSLDPQLPLTHVEPMEQAVEDGQASRLFNTVLVSSFAAAAVLLALLGNYSVIAFSAALRTQEMVIRLALGAQRSSIVMLVLASGAKRGLAGCGIGILGSLFATRLLRSLLFQVDPLDPAVTVLAAFSIFVLALAASIIPAQRAASSDPVQALRAE
jgi:ABC-type antimicrobial peptide transport system permease subunit